MGPAVPSPFIRNLKANFGYFTLSAIQILLCQNLDFSLKGCVPYLARSLLTIAATPTGIGQPHPVPPFLRKRFRNITHKISGHNFPGVFWLRKVMATLGRMLERLS
jgi:hypothetical protein